MRTTGTVKWFNDAKGFGFITPDGEAVGAVTHQRESNERRKLVTIYALNRSRKA